MSLVIVETQFSETVSFDQLNEEEERLVPCLAVRQVTWRYSLLSADRHRMICTYEAPDAECVRTGYHRAKVHFNRIWAGELLEPETAQSQQSPASRIVMEATSPALSPEEWHEIQNKLLHSFSAQRIEWLRAYRSLDRTTVIWELYAPDMQTVVQCVQVGQQANISCNRIWPAELLNPEIWIGLGFAL